MKTTDNNTFTKFTKDNQLKVLIIGCGAAGSAAAWSLSRYDRYRISVWEKAKSAGGVATTETLSNGYSVNVGVQGRSTIVQKHITLTQNTWNITNMGIDDSGIWKRTNIVGQ